MRSALPLAAILLAGCGGFAPGPAVISLSPAAPTTTQDIVVSIDKDALDPEGGELSYRYLWYRDGELQADVNGQTVSAELTAKGQLWRVQVIANDGNDDGPAMGAEVTVINTPPTVSLSIAPDAPLSSDDIVASATSEDIDGDTVSLDWSWTRDSSPTSYDGDTVPSSATVRLQTWEVTVVPSDDEQQGEPVRASVQIENSPPVITSVSISPTEAYEDTLLQAQVQASDSDNDSVDLEYSWYVDDTLRMQGSATTLGGGYFDKHQQVRVEVTPSDGYSLGETEVSNTVEILNSPPELDGVGIEPATVYESSTASCGLDGLNDEDGDTLSIDYSWTINGSVASTAASIDGALFDRGDVLACSVTLNDGEEDGPPGSSSSVTVQNSPPSISSVSISPASPAEGDTVTATVSGSADADGDAVVLSYAWYVGGAVVSNATSLPSALFQKGDSIRLVVTPTDGIDVGSAVSSGTITAVNTAPSFTGLTVSPSSATAGGTLTATPSGWSDADGDAASYLYAWIVDGTVVGTSSSLGLSPYGLGSQVYVHVTAHDGDAAGNSIASDTLVIQAELLSSDADTSLLGQRGELLGRSLALGGDLSGDGHPDLILGAPRADGGGSDNGVVYLVSNPASGSIEPDVANAALLEGPTGSEAGWSLSFAGDVDGDGHSDLIVGAPSADNGAGDASGAAYLVFGPMAGDRQLELTGDVLLGSSAGDEAGWSVAGVGDLDGDGLDDFAVGAAGVGSSAGAVYVGYGPGGGSGYLVGLDAVLSGESGGDEAGWSVAGAGDFDGDGMDDMIIGAQGDASAAAGAGAAYVLLGPVGGGDLGAVAEHKLTGEHTWDYAGYSVSSAGDTDGDGLDDVMVCARWEDSGGGAAGSCYLVLGGLVGDLGLGGADAKLIGSAATELVGSAVCSLGDLDADGRDEVLIGGEGGAWSGSSAGVVYLVTGPISGTLYLADASALRFDGSTGDKLGLAVAGGGDIDGDGTPDLLLGAPYENSNGTSSGAAFLFSGADLD